MKDYRVELIPSAIEGLVQIGEYIALDNPVRAISFVDELTTTITNTLSIFPNSGRITGDLKANEEIRMFPYRNYKCYYRVKEDKQLVEILYIFNGSMNTENFAN